MYETRSFGNLKMKLVFHGWFKQPCDVSASTRILIYSVLLFRNWLHMNNGYRHKRQINDFLLFEYWAIVDKLPQRQTLITWLESVFTVVINIHVTHGRWTWCSGDINKFVILVHEPAFFYRSQNKCIPYKVTLNISGTPLKTDGAPEISRITWQFCNC